MGITKQSNDSYEVLLVQITELVARSKQKALRAVNTALVEMNWNIGKYIVEFEQKGQAKVAYGTSTLTQLSHSLTLRFGKGFSRPNLTNMRKFYLMYPDCQTVSDNLSWSHICLLMQADDELERTFYEKECISQHWDVRTLKRQMSSALFLRLAASKDKEGILSLAKQGVEIQKPEDVVRDSYTLEFLGIPEDYRYSETELEQRIIDNLQMFLLEMGKGLTWIQICLYQNINCICQMSKS